MRQANLKLFAIILGSLSGVFLYIQYVTHNEFMFHLAAIPIEVLTVLFIAQRFFENVQNQEKRRRLMYIKSYLFRAELSDLYIMDFLALETPVITMAQMKHSTLEELKQIRESAANVKYKSLEAMESVVDEYVNAQHVWHDLMERAITYDFEDVFQNMIELLHFVHDVKVFRDKNQGKLFGPEASENEMIRLKVEKVLGDGIRSFLDYAIELKEKQSKMYLNMMTDYELAWNEATLIP
jgi:hypothetical protein